VEAWFAKYLYQGGGNGIVALGYGGGGEQFVLDTGNGSTGTLRFLVRNAAGTPFAANSTLLLDDSKWHHAVGVCDEAGGHLYLYVDGSLVATGTITANSGLLSSSVPVSIGARQSANATPANYDYQFIGQINDVAIYNQALNATQVQNHYFAAGVGPAITQLLPSNQETTNQGATASFTVTATGTSPLFYQWQDPNSQVIAGATNATLSLSASDPASGRG